MYESANGASSSHWKFVVARGKLVSKLNIVVDFPWRETLQVEFNLVVVISIFLFICQPQDKPGGRLVINLISFIQSRGEGFTEIAACVGLLICLR